MNLENPVLTDPYGEGVLSKDLPSEFERLRSLEESMDPTTLGVLDRLPVEPTWRCLELGAGAGSIAYELARRCPRGTVVAADIDTRYLDAEWKPNLEITRFDVRHDTLPDGAFDLIHCRLLLEHLPERERILATLTEWLAPGGWLVVEDGYWHSHEESLYPEVGRVTAALAAQFEAQGADMRWSRRLPSLIARSGLADVDVALTPLYLGQAGTTKAFDRHLRKTIDQVSPVLVASGQLTEEELGSAYATLAKPDFIELAVTLVSSWGRRPAG
ncbi:class I SAM-dependent methyltransferase [Amycolatopsis suaedae]|uniref:Class I SAM-dependent methyltransferase n=1 Tax=Amycolatopsis suaedae TaxID=2510978 RepID=A0A4Q7IX55_9PSEU|nr:class I SAM-dependent methyltransferase [Amycolatopsis suaedae]RZQ59521.1 class I SAM-dependent methyltransferase [Amycolatopsis suaedae]